jgi:hypothetical protein
VVALVAAVQHLRGQMVYQGEPKLEVMAVLVRHRQSRDHR